MMGIVEVKWLTYWVVSFVAVLSSFWSFCDLAFGFVLQEISIAANVPQKEIGKYIKILGEALQLSQPINSNSISVHMPRFCTLLQLNKSAQVPFVLLQSALLELLITLTYLDQVFCLHKPDDVQ